MTDTETARALVAAARADRLRPGYHFTAPAGWLNDPNGVAQLGGTHHLFYQHNPHAPVHHEIHWGHAVSDDLVHWRDRPIALRPGDGADAEGCWSGVLVDDGGVPTIVYSGREGQRELPCIAVGSPDLDTWQPLPEPVIAAPPAGDLTAYRDHCVWREGGRWRQLIGSGIRGEGGCAFLYESDDLRSWRYVSPLVVGEAGAVALDDPDWTGTMWECVDFFRLTPEGTGAPDPDSGETHAFIFSAWHENRTLQPLIALGSYAGDRFELARIQRLDLGRRHAYAPQTYRDEAGRRILWSWMQEGRTDAAAIAAGWSGAMALPRELTLDAAGVVRQAPVAAVATLREAELAEPWSGAQLDIEVEARVALGQRLEVVVLASPALADEADETAADEAAAEPAAGAAADSAADSERTVVIVERDVTGVLLSLDRSRSSVDATSDRSPLGGPVPAADSADDLVRLRVLVDRSSVEAFCDGIALTARVYPTRSDAIEASIAGTAQVVSARAWRMAGTEQADRRLDV